MADTISTLSEEQITARIERLPLTGWYARLMSIVGTAHFFDAFDSLTIAIVLPILVGIWHITPAQIGLLISVGFVGQMIGAVCLGWLAERQGRLRVLQWTLAIIALFSIACAFAWDYNSFLVFRTVQGIGLGAEVPIAATYLNEFTKAQYRGRLIIFLQSCFAGGIVITSLVAVWIIPHLGWPWMFILGTLPALLALGMRRLAPESPRWLASKRRLPEADAIVSALEARAERDGPLPPLPANIPPIVTEPAGFADLFKGIYVNRTLTAWAIAFCTAFVGYGLLTWLPTIFRTIYKLPIEQVLQYNLIFAIVGFVGALAGMSIIDALGRRICFLISFAGAGLGMIALWLLGDGRTPTDVIWLACISQFFMTFLLTGVYLYIPETYPTRMRALGVGVASSWMRIAAIVAPTIVGYILTGAGSDVGKAFLMFGIVGLVGAVVVVACCIETRGRILEEIAP
jgi:MFS transporter, putative metabolite:H+ symporter